MDEHLLIEGAAATILVVVGGFFVIAAWRAHARAGGVVVASSARVGRAELVPIIGIPLFGLVLLLVLIALANAGSAPGHPDGHGAHGRAPGAAWEHRAS